MVFQTWIGCEKKFRSSFERSDRIQARRWQCPSHLLIHGALAFPIPMNDSHQAFLAAACYGRGHVVVLAHENFFQASAMKSFILNAIGCLDAGKRSQVAIAGDLQDFFTLLSQEKIHCKLTDLKENLSVSVHTLQSLQ